MPSSCRCSRPGSTTDSTEDITVIQPGRNTCEHSYREEVLAPADCTHEGKVRLTLHPPYRPDYKLTLNEPLPYLTIVWQKEDLAVTAEGDNYITAAQDASNNKKINVTADVQALTATAGTVGTYAADGSETTAPTAGTLSGTADSLADGADIAAKVKTYVDGAIAIEAERSDAKNKADIAALDFADTAVAGQVVTEVDETDGVIAPTRANLSGITLAGFTADTSATGDIAATDTVAAALNKLQNKANAVQYQINGTTLEFFGINPVA